MRRRKVFTLLGGAAVWPVAVRAQQKRVPVVGYLGSASPGSSAPYLAAFHRGLSEGGYVDGQNLVIEYRWAEGRYDLLPAFAAELAQRQVDVIAAIGDPAGVAAKSATSTIPVVFLVGNPDGLGLVASLARPDANLTGVSLFSTDLTSKRLELLSELVPQARVIALLVNPNNPNTEQVLREVQEAAGTKGVQLPILKAANESEIEAALASIAQLHAGALLVGSDPFFFSRRAQFVALAARHAVPTIYQRGEFVAEGGLVSYGSSLANAYRQAGIYAGKILKGAKPANLPVEQPTRFELVLNLKTAQELGLTVPQSILSRVDEVIE
jgi:putative ABC transport system substrate-binding protein